MNSIKIKTLKDLTAEEVLDLLARAYLTNPVHIAAFGGSSEKELKQGRQLFSALFGMISNHQCYAAIDKGIIVGVYQTIRFPGCMPSEDKLSTFGTWITETLPEVAPRVAEWLTEWGKHHPSIDHWHFGPIAVPPELQKRGIGKLMMQHFCEIADKSGNMAYLETDRPENVGFYEKSGFRVVEQGMVLGVPNWHMTRTVHDAQ